jgi:hypothetical protein
MILPYQRRAWGLCLLFAAAVSLTAAYGLMTLA